MRFFKALVSIVAVFCSISVFAASPTEANIDQALKKENLPGLTSLAMEFHIAENVQFLADVNLYKEKVAMRATLGKAMYEKYIKEKSPRQINIESIVSAPIKTAVDAKQFEASLFDAARKQIMSLTVNAFSDSTRRAKWEAFALTMK